MSVAGRHAESHAQPEVKQDETFSYNPTACIPTPPTTRHGCAVGARAPPSRGYSTSRTGRRNRQPPQRPGLPASSKTRSKHARFSKKDQCTLQVPGYDQGDHNRAVQMRKATFLCTGSFKFPDGLPGRPEKGFHYPANLLGHGGTAEMLLETTHGLPSHLAGSAARSAVSCRSLAPVQRRVHPSGEHATVAASTTFANNPSIAIPPDARGHVIKDFIRVGGFVIPSIWLEDGKTGVRSGQSRGISALGTGGKKKVRC